MPNGVRRLVGILRYIITIFRLFPDGYCIFDTTRPYNEKAGICGFVKKAAGREQTPGESVKNIKGHQAKGQMEHPNARRRRPKNETLKPDAGSVTKHGYQ
jgi:hypothetical protein